MFLSLGFPEPEIAQPLITRPLGEKRGWFYAKNTYGEEETACVGMGWTVLMGLLNITRFEP